MKGELREKMPMKYGVMTVSFRSEGSTRGIQERGTAKSGGHPIETRSWGEMITQKKLKGLKLQVLFCVCSLDGVYFL